MAFLRFRPLAVGFYSFGKKSEKIRTKLLRRKDIGIYNLKLNRGKRDADFGVSLFVKRKFEKTFKSFVHSPSVIFCENATSLRREALV